MAFLDCGEVRLSGKVQQVREQLVNLLPRDHGVPDYETQDAEEFVSAPSDAETEDELISVDISLEEMEVGQYVEVYWSGEQSWFQGEITNISLEEAQFEIYYPSDKQTFWHNDCDYQVRQSC